MESIEEIIQRLIDKFRLERSCNQTGNPFDYFLNKNDLKEVLLFIECLNESIGKLREEIKEKEKLLSLE